MATPNPDQVNGGQPTTQPLPNPVGGGQTPATDSTAPPLAGSSSSGSDSSGRSQYPWLDAWNGPFAAPMTGYENQALGGLSNFVGGGQGLNGAQGYLNSELSGNYLSGNNPNFQAISDSGTILKNQQDAQALKEMQSRAAAGGNALSGALMGQEQQYQQGSNASFDNMMANLRAKNYQNERGLQQQAVGQMGDLAQQQLRGYGQLGSQGAVPRDIANQEIAGQYGDFNRQNAAMRDQWQYPDQLALSTLGHGYPGVGHQVGFGNSDLQNLLELLNQGQGSGTDIMSTIASLFGGSGGSGGSGSDTSTSSDSSGGADGIPAYDGQTSYAGTPIAYPDYSSMLTQEQTAAKNVQQNAGKASGATKAMGIMGLLMALLRGYGNAKGGGSKIGSGGGGNKLGPGAADKAGKPTDTPWEQAHSGTGTDQYGVDPYTGMPPGASESNGVGNIDMSNYGYPGYISDNPDLAAAMGNIPSDYSNPDYQPQDNSGQAPDLSSNFGNLDTSGGADPFAGVDMSSYGD